MHLICSTYVVHEFVDQIASAAKFLQTITILRHKNGGILLKVLRLTHLKCKFWINVRNRIGIRRQIDVSIKIDTSTRTKHNPIIQKDINQTIQIHMDSQILYKCIIEYKHSTACNWSIQNRPNIWFQLKVFIFISIEKLFQWIESKLEFHVEYRNKMHTITNVVQWKWRTNVVLHYRCISTYAKLDNQTREGRVLMTRSYVNNMSVVSASGEQRKKKSHYLQWINNIPSGENGR